MPDRGARTYSMAWTAALSRAERSQVGRGSLATAAQWTWMVRSGGCWGRAQGTGEQGGAQIEFAEWVVEFEATDRFDAAQAILERVAMDDQALSGADAVSVGFEEDFEGTQQLAATRAIAFREPLDVAGIDVLRVHLGRQGLEPVENAKLVETGMAPVGVEGWSERERL